MEIISRGEEAETKYVIDCGTCGCKFRCTAAETRASGGPSHRACSVVVCPQCKTDLFRDLDTLKRAS